MLESGWIVEAHEVECVVVAWRAHPDQQTRLDLPAHLIVLSSSIAPADLDDAHAAPEKFTPHFDLLHTDADSAQRDAFGGG